MSSHRVTTCNLRPVRDALRPLMQPGDKMIYRSSFRWMDDATDEVMSNHYECQTIEGLAADHGYEVIHHFNHIARQGPGILRGSSAHDRYSRPSSDWPPFRRDSRSRSKARRPRKSSASSSGWKLRWMN